MNKRLRNARRVRRGVVLSVALVLVGGLNATSPRALAGGIPAVTNWTNPTGGLWFDSANWSNGVPSFGQTANFPTFDSSTTPGTSIMVDLGGDVAEVDKLTFANSNQANRYLVTNGGALVRTIGSDGSFGFSPGDHQIDIRISAQSEGQLVELGAGFFSQGSFEFSQPIGQWFDSLGDPIGTNNFPVQASGRFAAENTYIGTTHVARELVLTGLFGSLQSQDNYASGFFGLSAAAVNVRNARLVLDNRSGASSSRLRDDMRLGLKSAVLTVFGNATDPVNDNLGGLLMESGETELSLIGEGSALDVSVAAISRSATYKPTLVVRANDLTLPQIEVFDLPIVSELRGPGVLETPTAPVIPWAVANTSSFSGDPEDLVPMTLDGDADQGIYILRPLQLGEALVDAFPSSNSGGSDPANVVFTNATSIESVSSSTTITSLTLPGSFALNVDSNLTVESGAIVFNGRPQGPTFVQGAADVVFNDTGYLHVDMTPRDPLVRVQWDVPMVGTQGMVKSGPGTLVLGAASPNLSGDFIVQNGDIVPQDPLAFGTGRLVIAGGSDFGREARLVIRQDLELNNRIIGRTFGDYGAFGILWYAPIVLFNGSTLRLNADPGGDSFYSLQSGDASATKVVLQSTTPGSISEFGYPVSIFVFDNVNLEVNGTTANSLGVFSPTSRLTGTGATLGVIESYGGTVAPGNDLTPIASLTATRLSGFGGTLELDIGGPNASDQIILAVSSNGTDPETFLSGIALNLLRLPTYTPQLGDVITLVDIAGTVSVQGVFAGLSEGQTFSFDGFDAHITYTGADGNDIQLIIGPGNPGIVKGDFGGAESPDGSFNTPDDSFNELDVEGFLLALNDQTAYLSLNPTLGDSLVGRGDFGGAESTDGSFNTPDGDFNELDVEGFLLALNDPAGYAAIQPTGRLSPVPEPAALGLLAPLGLLLTRRRR